MWSRIEANIDAFNQELLNQEETEILFDLMRQILQYIDDSVVLDGSLISGSRYPDEIRGFLIGLKHGQGGPKQGYYSLADGKLVFTMGESRYVLKLSLIHI